MKIGILKKARSRDDLKKIYGLEGLDCSKIGDFDRVLFVGSHRLNNILVN